MGDDLTPTQGAGLFDGYILDLLARVVMVSVETVRIVRGLPRLDLETLS